MHGTHALPRRRIVATFDTYTDAQSTIERLADGALGDEHATILAEGLRLVGRPSPAGPVRASVTLGAFAGAIVGILLAWAYGLVAVPGATLPALLLGGVLIGLGVGTASGWLAARLAAARPDPAPRTGLDAERFSVVVDEEVADMAVSILRMTVAGRRSIAEAGGIRPWAPTEPGPEPSDDPELPGSRTG